MSPQPWPIFDVYVAGFPSFSMTAPTRGKAMSAALRSYQNYDDRMTYGRFLRIARARKRREQLDVDGYDYVRRAYGVDARIGATGTLQNEGSGYNGRRVTVIYPNRQSTAYVHVVDEDGRDFIVHPLSIAIDAPDTRERGE